MKHFDMSTGRGVALVASAAVLALVAGGGGAMAAKLITSADIQDKTIKTVDLHKNAVQTQKVKDGTLKLADLNKHANDTIKKGGPQGPAGPAGPQGPKGDPASTRVTNLSGAFTANNSSVTMTPDGVAFGPYANGGAAGGSMVFTGLNGSTLSALKNVVYYMRYTATDDTGGVGVPYLRVFLTNNTHDAIFSPNTQAPDPDVAQGPFHEWVATSGSWRYDDDAGNGPSMSFASLVAAHGNETISGIRVSTGNTNGTNLSALLRWMQVNGTYYSFGS